MTDNIKLGVKEFTCSKIIIADFLEDFASEFPALFGFTFSLTFFWKNLISKYQDVKIKQKKLRSAQSLLGMHQKFPTV